MVLLDLNLPRITGREVLLAMKVDGKLQQIPVLVVSGVTILLISIGHTPTKLACT